MTGVPTCLLQAASQSYYWQEVVSVGSTEWLWKEGDNNHKSTLRTERYAIGKRLSQFICEYKRKYSGEAEINRSIKNKQMHTFNKKSKLCW